MKVSMKKNLLFTGMFLTIFGLLTGLCFADLHSIVTPNSTDASQQVPNVQPINAKVSVAVGSNGRVIVNDSAADFAPALDPATNEPVLNPTQILLQEKAKAEAINNSIAPAPIDEVQAPEPENNSEPVMVTVQKPILPDPAGISEQMITESAKKSSEKPESIWSTIKKNRAQKNHNNPNCGCNSACCNKSSLSQLLEKVQWSGYANAGYDSNFSGDRSNGLVDCWNTTDLALNSIYLSAVKKTYTGGCGADLGFGVDFMFGQDARLFESARGLDATWDTGSMYNPRTGTYDRDAYGFAMPQLYVEAAINNWSVKVGHFYGLLGYESVKASDRFFYTKGLGFQVTPITQSGFLASYNGFQNLDITLGWVNGWGNGFDNSDYVEGMATGAFTYRVNPCTSIKYAFQSGTADMNGVMGFVGPYADMPYKGVGSMHNINFIVQLNPYLESATTFHYGDYGLDGNTNNNNIFLVWGEHLYYTINCCWKVGMRFEWMKNTLSNNGTIAEDEITSLTFGANWHPAGNQNFVVRPELRYDRVTGANSGILLNGRPDQLTMGFDVMYKF